MSFDPDFDIKKASEEFIEIVRACYVFFTKNGLDPKHVKDFLHQELENTCNIVESEVQKLDN